MLSVLVPVQPSSQLPSRPDPVTQTPPPVPAPPLAPPLASESGGGASLARDTRPASDPVAGADRDTALDLAAELAAERIGEGDNRRRFQAMLDAIDMNDADPEAGFFGKNLTFHDTILKISGNRELQGLLSRMQLPIIMLQVQNAMRTDQFQHSTREHRDIAAAILAGNPAQARQTMEAHLRRSGSWVQTLPEKLFRAQR